MTFLKPANLSINTQLARSQKLNRKHSSSRLQLRYNSEQSKLRDAVESSVKRETPDQQVKRLLCEANIHRRKNNMTQAIECFRRCLQIKPGTMSIYIYLSKALENCQRDQEAYKVLQECVFTNSENPKAYDLMVEFCMNHEMYSEARLLIHEALKLDPDNLQFHVTRCKILFILGEYEDVMRFSSKILARCQGKCVALRLLHVESVIKTMSLSDDKQFSSNTPEAKRIESLVENLRDIISLAPKNVRAKVLLADLLTFQGHFEEAYKVLRQALELDPLSDEIQDAIVDLMDVMDFQQCNASTQSLPSCTPSM